LIQRISVPGQVFVEELLADGREETEHEEKRKGSKEKRKGSMFIFHIETAQEKRKGSMFIFHIETARIAINLVIVSRKNRSHILFFVRWLVVPYLSA